MDEVIPLARIQREAQAAATRYSDLNAACPYPFGSDAAHAFCAEFNQARADVAASQEKTCET
ncbi:hypothetical protein [Xylophilus sp. Leaf220]|uniref:hypothetical protein n=1 Tax=Xylophilus sp. Leaf220 TaxID=1735686 RepID=UPI0006F9068A|nr:hypothetical protein [Xylophilus sp. Leaf220]KQM68799.1 hypothetical protein ASE76_13965 [Xylophilus sp. Leaf220]